MKRGKALIHRQGFSMIEDVWLTDVPGLVIADNNGWYTVTHVASGKAVPGDYEHLYAARFAAEQFASLADWTLPESELSPVMKIPGVNDAIELALSVDR